MRQVCYVCGILYGITEPLYNDEETYGLCPECLEIEQKCLGKEVDDHEQKK